MGILNSELMEQISNNIQGIFEDKAFQDDLFNPAYEFGSELNKGSQGNRAKMKSLMTKLMPEFDRLLRKLAGDWLKKPGAIKGVANHGDLQGIFYAEILPRVAKKMAKDYDEAKAKAIKQENPAILDRVKQKFSGRAFSKMVNTAITNQLRDLYRSNKALDLENFYGEKELRKSQGPLTDQKERKAIRDTAEKALQRVKDVAGGIKSKVPWSTEDYKFLKALVDAFNKEERVRAMRLKATLANRSLTKKELQHIDAMPGFSLLGGLTGAKGGGGAPAFGLIKKALTKSKAQMSEKMATRAFRNFVYLFYRYLRQNPVGRAILPDRTFSFQRIGNSKGERFAADLPESFEKGGRFLVEAVAPMLGYDAADLSENVAADMFFMSAMTYAYGG